MGIQVGVLSDTHLSRVTKEFKDIYKRYLSHMDVVLHAGDIVSTGIVEFLNRDDFHGVHGNMDPADIKVMLPDKKVIKIGSYKIGLIHGWGSTGGLEDRILPEFTDVDVIVYGHSHLPVNHVKGGVLLFNPGTATGYTPTGRHSLGLLELDEMIKGTIIDLNHRLK